MRKTPVFLVGLTLMIGLGVASMLLPDRAYSSRENRPLATLPPVSAAALVSGTYTRQLDSYVNDQLALRDSFVSLSAVKDAALLKTERSGILYGSDQRLFEADSAGSPSTIQSNYRALASLAERAQMPVDLLRIPLPEQAYPQQLPAHYPLEARKAFLAASLPAPASVRLLDPGPAMLASASDAPLYYRTDHHLTLDGARLAYLAVVDSWGIPPAGRGEVMAWGGFYGSYFSRSPSPFIPPDTLRFEVYPGLSVEANSLPKDGLVDEALLSGYNQYAALLFNNPGHLRLENPGATGKLLVLRDSYATALLPALAQHFAVVDAIDPRYFTDDLGDMIDQNDYGRILCIYGTDTLATDRNLLRLLASF